ELIALQRAIAGGSKSLRSGVALLAASSGEGDREVQFAAAQGAVGNGSLTAAAHRVSRDRLTALLQLEEGLREGAVAAGSFERPVAREIGLRAQVECAERRGQRT